VRRLWHQTTGAGLHGKGSRFHRCSLARCHRPSHKAASRDLQASTCRPIPHRPCHTKRICFTSRNICEKTKTGMLWIIFNAPPEPNMLASVVACPAWILSHRCEESSVRMKGRTRVSGGATPRIATNAEAWFWVILHAANKEWCRPRPSHRATLAHSDVGVGLCDVKLRRRHCAGCTSYLLQQHASVQRNIN
jgi:hypothetical protein